MPERTFLIYLTLEEGNLLLEALAELPFKLVFELIGELNQQANTLFSGHEDFHEKQRFSFSGQEVNLAIKALGVLPYNRVHLLLSNLNQQISDQCISDETKADVEV